MTIHTDIRIHDPNTDGFDYQLTEDDRNVYTVTHSGKYVGAITSFGGAEWTVHAAAVFGTFEYGSERIGHTAGVIGDAVAILHNHWTNR